MGRNIFNTTSKQSTESITQIGQNAALSKVGDVKNALGDIQSQVRDGTVAYRYLKALSLSEYGVIRQQVLFPNGVSSQRERVVKAGESSQKESTSTRISDERRKASDNSIISPINDCIFQCGDYFMPLSINYSISADKITAESQLVDGINIIERIANKAKRINVSFFLERKEGSLDEATMMRVDSGATAIYRLKKFLTDLWETDEVFKVVNTVINDEFNVEYAFISSLTFNPQQGSTMAYISLMLQEVNIKDSLLYVAGSADTDSGSIPTA